MIKREVITSLINTFTEDKEMLDIINSAMESFIEYYHAIYNAELYSKVYSYKSIERDEYKAKLMELDRVRSLNHNEVLTKVALLNRLAAMNNLGLVYDGVISEERPYRREVANAVIEYIETIVKERK